MGLFSRKPPPPLPDRSDLHQALAGLDPADAQRISGDKRLVQMCHDLPPGPVTAVLEAIIDSPADKGLLHVSPEQVVFAGGHSGVTYLPAAAVAGAEVPFAGTLRVLYQPTVPGVSISFKHDKIARRPGDPEGLDFTIRAQPASLDFFCARVREMARA